MSNLIRKIGVLGISALAVAGLAIGCQAWDKKEDKKNDNGKPAVSAEAKAKMENIVMTAMASDDLSTLVGLLKSAELVKTLEGKGPFTVFAPTNEAFAKLGKDKLAELKKPENREKLKKILLFHVVSGDISSAKLADMSRVKTEEGDSLAVTKRNGKIYIGNAQVVGSDIDASNGVVHLIDKVMMPPADDNGK